MAHYHNLTDEERDRYNLPPAGFQGNEMTVVVQAPSLRALTEKTQAFKRFATGEGYETFQVLSYGPDPDGGFKAIIEAHNFNPVTWASEQYHRAKLGVQHGVEQGRKKAEIKHRISQAAELQATGEREITLQRARLARLRAAAPVRIETEAEAGRLLEERRRQRRLAALRPELAAPKQSIEEYVFGTQVP